MCTGGHRSREVRCLAQHGSANLQHSQSRSQIGPCVLCSALPSGQPTFGSPAPGAQPLGHGPGMSRPPQAAVSRVSSQHSPPPPPPPIWTALRTHTGEMSALYNSNSEPSTHTKSTLKNIKLFPSLNPKCHKTNCILAIYLEISLVLIAGTPECFSIRSGSR